MFSPHGAICRTHLANVFPTASLLIRDAADHAIGRLGYGVEMSQESSSNYAGQSMTFLTQNVPQFWLIGCYSLVVLYDLPDLHSDNRTVTLKYHIIDLCRFIGYYNQRE